ncbi:lipoprotein [Thermopolyspora flexuosa]|uniref:Uncharacterized protein (DUF58 family) n=1 Tax=Thermopolyspora flexuosa TaxID=103836 RepID=A0A543J1X8_9ACTN|nr:DUF58 domain-containing protein [Thermopolyspora flexuosa]TQM76829.1 uncharacterized protein (DUF58 family) [Thermopolyspora flexuosa]GGM87059.1 lipoprotein [Thermopolyspora flexuosa]
MALTGRAALLAALCSLVVPFTPRPGLTVLGAWLLLAVLVAVDLAAAGAVRVLRFRRDGERLVRLGGTVAVGLVVENPGRRRVRAVIRDAWPPSARPSPRAHRVTVPAGERRRLVTVLAPVRRGDREAVAVTVRSFGPLGLAARQGTHLVPWTVRVLPPFHSRRHLPSRLARLRELEGGNPVLVRGQGTEFDSLREYVVGDDVRSIDWRATARRGDVVVRTWRPERDRRVVIVLDTGRTSAGRLGVNPAGAAAGPSGWPRLDWSMDAALLLAALAARAGDRVDVLAYDRAARIWLSGVARTELLSAMVNAFAPLEPELVETDFAGMAATVLARAKRRCLVVLLTDLNAAALEEGLLPVLPSLSARHLVLVAAARDSRVADLAARRGDAESVYDAAAAERHIGERRAVTARLRRLGVEVVDALPEDLAPALADAYIALKAAGRL